MSRISYDTAYLVAWLICVVTLPFTIPLNSLSLILLALVWLTELNFSKKWERLKSACWIWPFILFFFMHVIGLTYSEHRVEGNFEVEKKLAFLAFPIIAASGKPLTKSHFDILKKGFIYSCLIVIVISFIWTVFNLINHSSTPQNFDAYTSEQFYFLNPSASLTWEYFSYIQLGNWIDVHPAYFSMYLIFCMTMLTQEMFDDCKINFRGLILIGLFTISIALLASRMAIISYFVLLFFIIFFNVMKNKNYKILIVPCLFIFMFVILIFVNPVSRFRLIQEPLRTSLRIDQNKKEWNSVSFRLLEWSGSLEELKKSWLLGVGTGDSQATLQAYYSKYRTADFVKGYNAHNQYLQTTLELGVIGLLLLLICIFRPIFASYQLQPAHVAFAILFGLMCFTESVLARQKGIVFFTMFQSLFFRYTQA